jgi:hypothetical protein
MAHVIYDNFYLSNEVEDQYNSHLDLQPFCTVDNSLEGVPGMKRRINVYSATDGTQKLAMGEGNTKSIEVSYENKEYEILMAQNRFEYYNEQAMIDPMLVPVGTRHMGTDLFNTVNAEIFAEFDKASLAYEATKFDFDAFVDASSALNIENLEGVYKFALVHPNDMARVRKALKDDLKYIEGFARSGYVGSVGDIHVHTKADATEGEIIVATKAAVTVFNKKGVETELERDANTRENSAFSRKYYVVALTDASKAVKIKLTA